jgi:anti-anti-sigma factor
MTTLASPSAHLIQLTGMLVRSQVRTQLQTWERDFQAFLATTAAGPVPRPVELVVSLKGIEKVDTAGLAVLLHASRQAAQHGITLVFQDASSQLLALTQLCSLNKLLRFT